MKLSFIIMFILISFYFNAQKKYTIYPESIKIMKSVNGLFAIFDTSNIVLGNYHFQKIDSGGQEKIIQLNNGTILTEHYQGSNNTALIKNLLLIFESDSILFYDCKNDSLNRIVFNNAKIIGQNKKGIYFSSGIFMNALRDKKIHSNSIVNYNGEDFVIIENNEQGKEIDGRFGFKINEFECVYFSDKCRIYSSFQTSPANAEIKICTNDDSLVISPIKYQISHSNVFINKRRLFFINSIDGFIYEINIHNLNITKSYECLSNIEIQNTFYRNNTRYFIGYNSGDFSSKGKGVLYQIKNNRRCKIIQIPIFYSYE